MRLFASLNRQPARLPRRLVRPTYTWLAPVHDALALLVAERARAVALDWANVQDGETVLEVAAGTGLTFRRLLTMNRHGWTDGIDLTPAMLRRARRRAARTGSTRYHLRLGDAYALPFADDRFDVLMNSYMFDILPHTDFPKVLGEFYRVLRPGGRLVMINMTPGLRWYHTAWEALYRLHPAFLGGCRGIEARPVCEQAGFVRIQRAFVSQHTFPSEVIYAEKPGECRMSNVA